METAKKKPQRKHLLGLIALAFIGAGIAYGAYWGLHSRYHEITDDAYVSGNLLRITPRVAGTVTAVLVDDTDYVQRGQVLVKLDDTDARVALAKAEADLGDTVRRVRRLFETVEQDRANLSLKQEALRQAEADLTRRNGAVADQAVSREEADHARTSQEKARAELKFANAQLAGDMAQVSGTTVENHPAVKQAEANLREAYLNLARCQIRAPENGYVAKRGVQVGQQVPVGAPLMAVVPLEQLWVDANFKEDQLARLRIGQPVELVSDLYGSGVEFHGKVVGLGAGTGGAFSLLPPQNASGNWIKIVQRLPVRVALDPAELAKHPLRVGLSMKADIVTRDTSGPALASGAGAGRYETGVYDNAEKEADKRIRDIVAANLGRPVAP